MRRPEYVLVLVLSLQLAVWEAFLVAARPFGTSLPLAAALAVVGNVVLARAARRTGGSSRAGFGPSLVWLAVAVCFSLPGPGGDAIVPGTARGVLYLVAGMVTAVAVVAVTGSKRASRATPGAQIGR